MVLLLRRRERGRRPRRLLEDLGGEGERARDGDGECDGQSGTTEQGHGRKGSNGENVRDGTHRTGTARLLES